MGATRFSTCSSSSSERMRDVIEWRIVTDAHHLFILQVMTWTEVVEAGKTRWFTSWGRIEFWGTAMWQLTIPLVVSFIKTKQLVSGKSVREGKYQCYAGAGPTDAIEKPARSNDSNSLLIDLGYSKVLSSFSSIGQEIGISAALMMQIFMYLRIAGNKMNYTNAISKMLSSASFGVYLFHMPLITVAQWMYLMSFGKPTSSKGFGFTLCRYLSTASAVIDPSWSTWPQG